MYISLQNITGRRAEVVAQRQVARLQAVAEVGADQETVLTLV